MPFFLDLAIAFFGRDTGDKDITEDNMVINTDESTSWILDNSIADFLLMRTTAVQFMCSFGYAFYVGSGVFKSFPKDASVMYKFISLVFSCTGGGILVPIVLNEIPFPLANETLMIAIFLAFLFHFRYPILRDVLDHSNILKFILILFHEITRTSVVVKIIQATCATISPSLCLGNVPLVGPVICGILGGTGGMFLPLNKGLEPIVEKKMMNDGGGMGVMKVVGLGVLCFHIFVNMVFYSEGVSHVKDKGHLVLAVYFMSMGLIRMFPFVREWLCCLCRSDMTEKVKRN